MQQGGAKGHKDTKEEKIIFKNCWRINMWRIFTST